MKGADLTLALWTRIQGEDISFDMAELSCC